jgi:hypothetical protein
MAYRHAPSPWRRISSVVSPLRDAGQASAPVPIKPRDCSSMLYRIDERLLAATLICKCSRASRAAAVPVTFWPGVGTRMRTHSGAHNCMIWSMSPVLESRFERADQVFEPWVVGLRANLACDKNLRRRGAQRPDHQELETNLTPAASTWGERECTSRSDTYMTSPRMPARTPSATPRLRWRVVVRTQGTLDPSRPSRPLAWHLVTCSDSERPELHCAEGRRRLAAGDDPDGHCLLNGGCPRCESQL